MIFLLYYVFYVVYVVKKIIIVLVKYQFPIEIISAKTRDISDFRNHGLHPWLIYFAPSALPT